MKTHNRACGWLSGQTKPYPPFDDSYERGAGLGATCPELGQLEILRGGKRELA
jgi:hypothetical protein